MQEHGFDASLLFASRTRFHGRLGWRSHLALPVNIIEPGAAGISGRPEPLRRRRATSTTVMALYDSHSAATAGATVRDSMPTGPDSSSYAGNPDEALRRGRDAGG